MPPVKYIRIADTSRALLQINYEQWLRDLEEAHQEYMFYALEQATMMFGDKGAEQYDAKDPALMRRIGSPPEAVERVQAAIAGNEWVLGKSPDKPKWAESYFPTVEREGPETFIRKFPNAPSKPKKGEA